MAFRYARFLMWLLLHIAFNKYGGKKAKLTGSNTTYWWAVCDRFLRIANEIVNP